MSKIEVEVHSKLKLLGELEIDIEPNAEDEPEYFYVVITDENGDVYEDRVYLSPSLARRKIIEGNRNAKK